MRIVARKKSQQNVAVMDPWTFVHVSTGLALGLMDVSPRLSLGAALVYEGVEQVIERHELGQTFFNTSRPETALNAAADVAAFALGYWLGRRWNRT